MVRMFTGLKEDTVAGNHVIDNVALRDLLGAERLRGRQVHTIIITQMVVTYNGGRLPQKELQTM